MPHPAARVTKKKSNEKNKSKNRDTQQTRSSQEVPGVSPEAGRGSMGRERFAKEVGFEAGVKE